MEPPAGLLPNATIAWPFHHALNAAHPRDPFRRIGLPMALRQASAERGGSREATAGAGRAEYGSHLEVPRSFLPTLKAGFSALAQTGLETALRGPSAS